MSRFICPADLAEKLMRISSKLYIRFVELKSKSKGPYQSMVEVIESVKVATEDGYELALEYGIWRYKGQLSFNHGTRFIWYKDGKKLSHRGQARMPVDLDRGFSVIEAKLKALASIEGWYSDKDRGPIVLGRQILDSGNVDRSAIEIPAQVVNA
jgi:hypothetical protein